MMKSLIATKPQDNGALIIRSGSVPNVVTEGIKDVLATFPGGAVQGDEDRARNLRGYLDAVEGLPQAVVMRVLKHFRFHNPRCTPRFVQPPFAQDVYEVANELWVFWKRAVSGFAEGTNVMVGNKWPATWKSHGLCCDVEIPMGPSPLEEGCLIPRELIVSILTEHFEITKDEGNGMPSLVHRLSDLDEKVFAWIPVEAFPDGLYADIVKAREQYVEAAKRQQEREAYIAGLDPELRRARDRILERNYPWRPLVIDGVPWSSNEPRASIYASA